ncbi:MAG: DUF1007 family protein [Roseovarius sp.]|nr:DUF1007 family protein [Roseovarius sp.]
MIRALLIALVTVCAPAARAHPHVFVDVTLRFLPAADGQLSGVEVTWRYDDFFSLLVLEDRGLDPDGDMRLSPAERDRLMGFDLVDWPDGFEGALFLSGPDGDVALGPPRATHVGLDGGRIVSRHVRPFPPVAADDLVARPYDPSYYAALDLVAVAGVPDGCAPRIVEADADAADARVAELGDAGREDFFEEVRVGSHYADRLEVSCAPSS